MNVTPLNWVDGPWPGRLSLAARPRGGDWLKDELSAWHAAGVDVILSLLTPEEERDLDITGEASEARAEGMAFLSFPICDRRTPESQKDLAELLHQLDNELASGRNVVVHCRQGIGRTGLVAACLLLSKGLKPETAITQLSQARGITIPDTIEQRLWIENYTVQ